MATSKRPYHHGNLASALVEAGMRMVEERSASDIGLREAAREAEVSPAAVYRHFANKEALLAAIAAQGFRLLNEAFNKAQSAATSPLDRLHALGEAYVRFAVENPGLYKLMFGDGRQLHMANAPEDLRAQSRSAFEALAAAVATCLGDGAQPRAVTAGSVAAWSLVHGYAMLLLQGQLDAISKDMMPDLGSVLSALAPRVG